MRRVERAVAVLLLVLVALARDGINGEGNKEHPIGRSRPKALQAKRLKEIASRGSSDSLIKTIKDIAVVRVPDTEEHRVVQHIITDGFPSELWHLERDTFHEETPLGEKEFTNLIFTMHGDHDIEQGLSRGKRSNVIVLACHYDSKYFAAPRHFVAATDSAVPCAILMDVAATMKEELNSKIGIRPLVKFVFLDGEEAFEEWTDTDSIYGARHLASRWQAEKPNNKTAVLDNVETFILLDLWGAPNTKFYSYHEDTTWLFDRLASIESKLSKNSLLTKADPTPFFMERRVYGAGLQDDHIPFLQRGVPVLHLIPVPFPKVWHSDQDDVEHLDHRVVWDLGVIFRCFVAEYLRL